MHPNNRKKKGIGFTLVEMLIVSAMLALISLVTYSVFNSGAKLWQRMNKGVLAEDINIFFDKFSSDLRNCLSFADMDFSGKEYEFEFATLVNSPKLGERTVGKVRYRYDGNKYALYAERMDYSDVYTANSGTIQQSLKNVKSLKFLYYGWDSEKKEYVWQGEWLEKGAPPLAVRIDLTLDEGSASSQFTKTVSMPISG